MFPAVDFRKWGRTLINDFHKVLIFSAKAEQKFWQKYSWYQKLPRSPSSLSSDKFDRIRVPCTLCKLSSSPSSQPSSDKDKLKSQSVLRKSQSVLKWKINWKLETYSVLTSLTVGRQWRGCQCTKEKKSHERPGEKYWLKDPEKYWSAHKYQGFSS